MHHTLCILFQEMEPALAMACPFSSKTALSQAKMDFTVYLEKKALDPKFI